MDINGDGCIESILYTFTLTNTGSVDINEITLEDELLGGEVPGPVDGTDTKNDDGTWDNVKELPFNDDSYSVAHPALNLEETRL